MLRDALFFFLRPSVPAQPLPTTATLVRSASSMNKCVVRRTPKTSSRLATPVLAKPARWYVETRGPRPRPCTDAPLLTSPPQLRGGTRRRSLEIRRRAATPAARWASGEPLWPPCSLPCCALGGFSPSFPSYTARPLASCPARQAAYAAESIQIKDVWFHKARCMKCGECGLKLNLTNYHVCCVAKGRPGTKGEGPELVLPMCARATRRRTMRP